MSKVYLVVQWRERRLLVALLAAVGFDGALPDLRPSGIGSLTADKLHIEVGVQLLVQDGFDGLEMPGFEPSFREAAGGASRMVCPSNATGVIGLIQVENEALLTLSARVTRAFSQACWRTAKSSS